MLPHRESSHCRPGFKARLIADTPGLEPGTFQLTAGRSNQLSYVSKSFSGRACNSPGSATSENDTLPQFLGDLTIVQTVHPGMVCTSPDPVVMPLLCEGHVVRDGFPDPSGDRDFKFLFLVHRAPQGLLVPENGAADG